jgi:hypothetical protein
VQVLAAPASYDNLAIYNSAGELVWETLVPNAIVTNPLSLPKGTLGLSLVNGQVATPFQINIGTTPFFWPGTNLAGSLVTPGVYSVKLSGSQTEALPDVQVKEFSVVATAYGAPALTVLIVPNPWKGTSALQIQYQVKNMGPLPGSGVYGSASVYNLMGERVAQAADPAGTGIVTLPRMKLSAGVYVVDFTVMNQSNIILRKLSKLAVVE